jgi:Phage integrase family
MSKSTHPRTRLPNDPERLSFYDWLPANRGLYENFRTWLKDSGYSPSALNQYGTAARHALGYLQKAYWQIDPEIDLPKVWIYLQRRSLSAASLEGYHKGLLKFGEYLRLRLKQPAPEKPLHWDYYLAGLPVWLMDAVRQYLAHCARRWSVERQTERAMDALSHLTLSLRQMQAHQSLSGPEGLTPAAWYAYLDQRLAAGIKPVTLNAELAALQEFVRFLENQGEAICERLLRVEALAVENRLPRDASPAQLRLLYQEIVRDADSTHGLLHRCGLMDQAWFLLMLHSGLRTGEVRRLKLTEVDFERRQVRLEQSKGLKKPLFKSSYQNVCYALIPV